MWPIFLEIIFWICQCCQSSEIRGICLMKQPSITVQIFPYFGIWKNPCGMYLDHFDHFIKHKSFISEEWWFRRSNKKKVATTINNNCFLYTYNSDWVWLQQGFSSNHKFFSLVNSLNQHTSFKSGILFFRIYNSCKFLQFWISARVVMQLTL